MLKPDVKGLKSTTSESKLAITRFKVSVTFNRTFGLVKCFHSSYYGTSFALSLIVLQHNPESECSILY